MAAFPPDATLVVKHTFLEFVNTRRQVRRASTDSCLSRLVSDSDDDEGIEQKVDIDAKSDVSTDAFAASSDSDTETTASTDGCSEISGPPGAFWVPMQAVLQPMLVAQPAQMPVADAQNSWTTVMLRNIPCDYTRDLVIDLLYSEGFCGRFNFFYLPMDFESGSAFGYAFVNLNTSADAQAFWQHFSGFNRWTWPSKKVAEVTWSRPVQGLQMSVERYRNSVVMHPTVPDTFKPVLLDSMGARVTFPSPSKCISSPKDATHTPAETANQSHKWGSSDRPSSRTTLMLRNLPNDYDRPMLLQLLDDQGFSGRYDFVYLPMDFKTSCGLGYAFVNMVSNEDAEQFKQQFSGFTNWEMPSRKVAEVAWSNPNQGLAVHIERYRNSNVMHEMVPDKFKPVLFQEGHRVLFPPPTRSIKEPPQGA